MAGLMTKDNGTGTIERRQPIRRRSIFDLLFPTTLAEPFPELSFARAMLNAIAPPGAELVFSPTVEVTEKDGKYLVDVALPGFRREDIELEVSGSEVTVSGRYDRKQENAKRHYSEMRQGSFTRTLVLPQEIDTDKVTASFDNGILRITAPPASQIQTKKVSIK
jgi:HSP20 family molecular chaperone IbpA